MRGEETKWRSISELGSKKDTWRIVLLPKTVSMYQDGAWLYHDLSHYYDSRPVAPTIYISNQVERPYIALGYFGDVDEELNLEECRKNGVKISRRTSGAGHIFVDGSSSSVFLVCDTERFNKYFGSLDEAFRRWVGMGAPVGHRLGASEMEYVHLGDLRIKGRKCGGSAFTITPGSFGMGFFMNLKNPDMDLSVKVLRIPPEKFADKEVKSFQEYVVSIEKVTGNVPSLEDFLEAVRVSAEERFGVNVVRDELTEGERVNRKAAHGKYEGDEWVYKRSSKRRFGNLAPGHRLGGAKHKARKLVVANVLADGDGVIREVMMCGDFMCNPYDAVDKWEGAMKGLSVRDEEGIKSRTYAFFKETGYEITGASLDEFLIPVTAAARQTVA